MKAGTDFDVEMIKSSYGSLLGDKGEQVFSHMLDVICEDVQEQVDAIWGVLLMGWCKYMLPKRTRELAVLSSDIWDLPLVDGQEILTAQNGISALQAYIRNLGYETTMRERGVLKLDSTKLSERILGEMMYLDCGDEKLYEEDVQTMLELTRG